MGAGAAGLTDLAIEIEIGIGIEIENRRFARIGPQGFFGRNDVAMLENPRPDSDSDFDRDENGGS